jgi:hypothetical protein
MSIGAYILIFAATVPWIVGVLIYYWWLGTKKEEDDR